MTSMHNLSQKFNQMALKHKIPGAVLGIQTSDGVSLFAYGATNLDTGVETTTDTVFQIGSITKPHTATLIMQLIEAGRCDLETTVNEIIPEFRTVNDKYFRLITLRHLLSHSSGLDGDFFVDSGRGDDNVKNYVDLCSSVPSLFGPGRLMSYCNVGYAVLGRVIEVLSGKTWDMVLRERLLDPLGMQRAFSLPEDALKYRCAIGHITSRSAPDKIYVSKLPYQPFGQKAQGTTLSMSAEDLLRFAWMHVNKGQVSNRNIVAAESARHMQLQQIEVPPCTRDGMTGIGLGWFLMNWSDRQVVGHDGETMGQYAFLRILEEKPLAVVLLCNGGDARGLYESLFSEIFQSEAGVSLPSVPEADLDWISGADRFVGRWENLVTKILITQTKGQLVASSEGKRGGPVLFPPESPLKFIDDQTARLATGDEITDRMTFRFTKGLPDCLFTGYRSGLRQLVRTG